MARRNRYKQMEQLLTKVLIGDAAVFVLYLIFAGLGVTAMKVITAIIAILASGLCLAFLYMNGELKKRRSRWLVMGYGAIVVSLLVSLLVNYPSPAKAKATSVGTASTSSTVDQTDAPTDGSTEGSETGASEATDVG